MAQTIKIKRSGSASATPSSLEHGELAINYADGKIFYKNSSNSIVEFSSSGSFLPLSGGTLTGTLTSKTINMQNHQLYGVNNLRFNDAGVNEGIKWDGGNEWQIYESPDNQSNASGNLQFTSGSGGGTRRATLDTSGNWNLVTGGLQIGGNTVITSGRALQQITSLSVDNITIDGTEIDCNTNLFVDVAGDITLDADGGDIKFNDGGTSKHTISMQSNGDTYFVNETANADIYFRGVDGSSTITGLHLDYSDAGAATFGGTVKVGDGAPSAPAITFSNDSDTGMYRFTDTLAFAVNGQRKAYVTAAGIFSDNNVYVVNGGQFRTFAQWTASTGGAGSGFTFINTQDSTTPLTISSTGNGVFAGTLETGGNISLDANDAFVYLSNVGTGNSGIYVRGRGTQGTLRSHTTTDFRWEIGGNERAALSTTGFNTVGTLTASGNINTTSGGYQINGASVIQSNFRITPHEHVIFSSTTGYIQHPSNSSNNAWAYGVSGGGANPGVDRNKWGLHYYNGTSWSNPFYVDTSGNAVFTGEVEGASLDINGSADISGNTVITGSGSSGNAFQVNRGNNGNQSLRIQNTGEIVTSSNYVYHTYTGGKSFYSQGEAVFRGGISNDQGDLDVKDNLDITGGALKIAGTSVITSGRTLQNVSGNISMFTNNSGYITSASIPSSLPANGGNADTVDNLHAASFVRSDSSDVLSGDYTFTGGAGAVTITNSDIRSNAASSWTGNPGTQGKIQYHSNRWYIVSDSSSNRIVQFRRDSTDKAYIDNDGMFHGNVTGNLTGNASSATTATNADTVDSLHASSFLRSDANDTQGNHTLTLQGVVRSTNDANTSGPNFNVATTTKSNSEYAYRVERSSSVVSGLLTDGRAFFNRTGIGVSPASDVMLKLQGATSASDETAFEVTANNGNLITYIRNDGVMIHTGGNAHYLYAASGGVSLYVQNDLVARGSIRNDQSSAPVRIEDDLRVEGDISNASGDLTLDIAGDIILDADGGDILLKDGGNTFGLLSNDNFTFKIQNHSQDTDIKIIGNDGGNLIDAATFDMSNEGFLTLNDGLSINGSSFMASGTLMFNGGNAAFTDDKQCFFGSSLDMTIKHNSSTGNNEILTNSDLLLDSATNIILDADGGTIDLMDGGTRFGRLQQMIGGLGISAGSTPTFAQLISSTKTLFFGHIELGDSKHVRWGNGSGDLQIYHDGSNSYIEEYGTGDLIITSSVIRSRTDDFMVNNAANNEHLIRALNGSSVFLYHDGVERFRTHSYGGSLTGSLAVSQQVWSGGNQTHTAPAYAFNNDTNTGMFRVSSDVLGFANGGTERFRLDSGGAIALNGNFAVLKGNTSNTFTNPQIRFGYSNTQNYQQSIRTRHNAGTGTGNAIDFFLWDSGTDAVGTLGTLRVASFETSRGLDIRHGGLEISGNTVINSNRVHLASDGSAAGPSFTFNSDTNTGMFRKSSDVIGFSTGGAERATIDSDGLKSNGVPVATVEGGSTSKIVTMRIQAKDLDSKITGGGYTFYNGGTNKVLIIEEFIAFIDTDNNTNSAAGYPSFAYPIRVNVKTKWGAVDSRSHKDGGFTITKEALNKYFTSDVTMNPSGATRNMKRFIVGQPRDPVAANPDMQQQVAEIQANGTGAGQNFNAELKIQMDSFLASTCNATFYLYFQVKFREISPSDITGASNMITIN